MIDFPAATPGQIFTAGDASWQWDGTKWVVYHAPSGPRYLVLDKLTAAPEAGAGIAALYAMQGTGDKAVLRVKAGTSDVAVDLITNVGDEF